jgi:prepilin-type N-terminal cleavage/methylation domain-containing protein
MSREHGFTLAELMISMTVTLIAVGAALTTFGQGLIINDTGTQLSDANQNFRAGMNQMVQDLMQAGRIIGPAGIPMPTGAGVTAFKRPGPTALLTFNLVVDADTTLNLPAITTGYQLGPNIIGSSTDMVTIMTVDEFMPTIQTPPGPPGPPTSIEGTIAPDGQSVLLPATSLWLTGDTVADTPVIKVGDLVLFSNPAGMALHTVTSTDATHIYFGIAPNANDWFGFNQFNAPVVPMMLIKLPQDTTSQWTQKTTMFRALMITYYVDNSGTVPLLTRVVNHQTPQTLAGVVEDLDLTYDLVDGVNNPTAVTSLPYTDAVTGVTYNSNEIRKVNVHMGVRSEIMTKPVHDYIRNHIATAVDVRSLASVNRYVTQ